MSPQGLPGYDGMRFPLVGASALVSTEPVPRKIRQLVSEFQQAGFIDRGVKGSHWNFEHAARGVNLTLSG